MRQTQNVARICLFLRLRTTDGCFTSETSHKLRVTLANRGHNTENLKLKNAIYLMLLYNLLLQYHAKCLQIICTCHFHINYELTNIQQALSSLSISFSINLNVLIQSLIYHPLRKICDFSTPNRSIQNTDFG